MRDPVKHRELAFEWKFASRARREAIYKAYGIWFTELMELPYWDPILFTVINDMHPGYLGLFKTHLREIWGIDHEKNSGDGLHPDLSDKKHMKLSNASLRNFLNEIRGNEMSIGAILLEEKNGVLWYLCFWLKLRTGLSSKQQIIDQILQWRSSVEFEQVPEVPPLDYNQVPDGWEGDYSHISALAEVPESKASDVSLNSEPSSRASLVASSVAPSIALSATSADALPPVSQPAPSFVFSKDSAFEKLKSKLLNLNARPPSLDKKKIILRALCQDLNILYNLNDSNKILAARLMVYRQENGAKDDEDSLQTRYNQFKWIFEEDEPSKSMMMSQLLKHLEKLCREYRIPPFDSPTAPVAH
ncbi:hypothetical protein F5051DRAFT_446569 [Lentinula edodes]|nr:hypothetical protein F5051DRAFT_446569 [Lentinula edodes]